MSDTFTLEGWLTTAEAAELTGYSAGHLRQLILRSVFKAQKRGRDWFIEKESLEAYVAKMDALGTKKFGPQSELKSNW